MKKYFKIGICFLCGFLVAIVLFLGIILIFGNLKSSDSQEINNKSTEETDSESANKVEVSHTFSDGSMFSISLLSENMVSVGIMGSDKEKASLIFSGLAYLMLKDYKKDTTISFVTTYKDGDKLKDGFAISYKNESILGNIPDWCDIGNTTFTSADQEYISQMETSATQFKKLINQ